MLDGSAQYASFIVTLGAVALAVGTGIWAYVLTRQARSANTGWRARAEQLEFAVDRANALMSAHPGVLFAWEEDASGGASGWGGPAMYGAPAAIASLLRFAEAADGTAPLEARILDGMADFDATDAAGETTTLRKALARLAVDGAPFSLRVHGPGGRELEVDGRPAASRIALWVADPNLKASEYLANAGRTDDAGKRIFDDPAAFEDWLQRLPLPGWRYSATGKLLWANTAFLAVVEAKDLKDAQARELHLDDKTVGQAREALENGEIARQRVITALGRQCLVEVLTFPISGGTGGVAVDMTSIAQSRDEAGAQADVRASALNRVDDAVAIFSGDRSLVFYNSAFVRLFKLDPKWLKQGPTHGDVLDRLHREGKIPTTADYASWRAGEMALYAHDDKPLADGFWELEEDVRLRVVRLRHPAGGGVVVFRDETEQHRLRADLNTRIVVQRDTLDKLSDAIAVFGSDGKCQLQNAAFGQMWDLPDALCQPGARFDDIVDACLPVFADKESWARMKARITNITNPEVRKQAEETLDCVDGRILKFISRPLADRATALSFSDITADRKLAKALEDRAEALAEGERVQNDFINLVSHRLRAPLQTVMGYAELLQLTLDPDGNAGPGEFARDIAKASHELDQMITNILDIATIDSQISDFVAEDMDIRPALDEAMQLAHQSADETQVRLVFDCPFDIGQMVADPKRVKQVIYNLLTNAVRHSTAGQQVELGARRGEGRVDVWVQDQGEGIAADKQATMFDQFSAGRGGGAGLGLALVKKFMERHGGWVDVESELGHGTRVTCHFPLESSSSDRGTALDTALDTGLNTGLDSRTDPQRAADVASDPASDLPSGRSSAASDSDPSMVRGRSASGISRPGSSGSGPSVSGVAGSGSSDTGQSPAPGSAGGPRAAVDQPDYAARIKRVLAD